MDQYTNEEKQALAAQTLNEQVDGLEKLPAANIIVAGITGSGKSTLINAVFGNDIAKEGSGRPVTDQMNEYQDSNVPICIWDTVGLELDVKKTANTIQDIRSKIAEKNQAENRFDRIHAIWYCIDSMGDRYQGAELEFIKSLHGIGIPFIIVLTKCINEKAAVDAFAKSIQDYNVEAGMDDIEIVQVCAKPYKISSFTIPSSGLEDLVNVTLKKLPEFIKASFVAAQTVSKLEKRLECENVIYRHVKHAKSGLVEKIPIANVFVANRDIVRMGIEIASMYRVYLPLEVLGEAIKHLQLDFSNAFWGLISPLDLVGYKKTIQALLKQKEEDGYQVDIDESSRTDRVASMVAFYGYTFIDAIEELWEKSTAEQLKDIDFVCDNLIAKINRVLNKRRAEAKTRSQG